MNAKACALVVYIKIDNFIPATIRTSLFNRAIFIINNSIGINLILFKSFYWFFAIFHILHLVRIVLPRGLEPLRPRGQRIFLLLYVTIATLLCCSLDYVFTMPCGLGSGCIVSTHLGIASI